MQFKKFQQYGFIGLLAMVTIAFLYIINDYLMPLFWALVFAILFYPVQKKLLKVFKKPALATVVNLLIIIGIFIIPLTTIGVMVVNESVALYQQVQQTGEEPVDLFNRFGETLVFLEPYGVSREEAEAGLASFAQTAASWLSDQAVNFGQKTFSIMIQFFIMLYILFFFLKDGEKIRKRFMEILPLGDEKEARLFAKFSSTTRAVVKGTLVIGFLQGLVGGILFAIAGIQGAALWGVLMMILSVIPAVGTIVVWLPAGIILLATGAYWQAAVVLAGGFLIVGLLDNILRPILVGKDTQMPDVIILLSTLGGLSVFGITGFVIGPVIAGFFIAMWDMFEEEYHDDLVKYG